MATEWLSVDEAANTYNVTRRIIKNAMDAGQVRFIQISGTYRIDADSIEALVTGGSAITVVGETGDTGNSTGPHIRFELNGQGEPAHD